MIAGLDFFESKDWYGKPYADNGGIIYKPREVKKVSRAYLETKVIKVGKPKPKREVHINSRGAGKSSKYWSSFSNEVLERLQINAKRELEKRKNIEPKPKGNWVNNENLDKIRFPVPCSFRFFTRRVHGMLSSGFDNARGNGTVYRIISIEEQTKDLSEFYSSTSLKNLIELYDVHILKGKFVIYEEVE